VSEGERKAVREEETLFPSTEAQRVPSPSKFLPGFKNTPECPTDTAK